MTLPVSDKPDMKGILCAMAGFGAFAVGDALGKWLTQDYPVTELIFFNGLLGLLVLLAAGPFFGGLRPTFRTGRPGLHSLRAIVVVSQCFMVIYAFSNLPMTTVYAFVFAAPLMITALSAPLLGQRVGMREWVGVLTGFTGIIIMLRPGLQPLDWPVLAAIGTAIFFSIGSLMVRMIGDVSDDHPFTYSAWPMLFMIPAGAASCLAWGFEIPRGSDFLLFLASGAAAGIGMVLMAVAFSVSHAAVVAPFHYTQMLWGVGFGLLIWNDVPDSWTMAGSTLVIASGLYVIRSRARKRKPLAVPVRDQS